MVTKMGELLDTMAGAGHGGVITRNPYGQIVRVRKCTNRRVISSFEVPGASFYVQGEAQKAIMASVSQAWRKLSPATQAGWYTLAATYTRTNKVGLSYVPSGYQLFAEWNGRLAAIQAPLNLAATPPVAHGGIASFTFVAAHAASVIISYVGDGSSSSYYVVNAMPYIPGSKKINAQYWRLVLPSRQFDTGTISLTTWLTYHYGTPRYFEYCWLKLQGIDSCGQLFAEQVINAQIL